MKILKALLFVCTLFLLVSCNGNVDEKLFVQNVITEPITFVVRDKDDTTLVLPSDINTTPVMKGYKSDPNAPIEIVVTFTFPDGLTLQSDLSKDSNLPSSCYLLNDSWGSIDITNVTVFENASKGSNILKVKIFCKNSSPMQGILTFTFADNTFLNANYKGPFIVIPFDLLKAA